MNLILLLAAALQSATPTPADDPEEITCNLKNRSQIGAERCAGEALKRAEDTLRFYWESTLIEYGTANRRSTKLLKQSQSDWWKYRNAWCEVVAHDNHGSLQMTKSTCKAKLTRERVQAVKDLIVGTNE